MRVIDFALDLLFPPKCAFCWKITSGKDEVCCQKCIESLPYAAGGGRTQGGSFDYCVSPLYYSGQVRQSILRFKFRGAAAYADIYGMMLAACISEYARERHDLVTWVPLSRKRRKSRGYDQAKLLAEATARHLGMMAAQTLKKTIDAGPQSELPGRAERQKNIKGVFEALCAQQVAGKRILLIDDIITTGATLSECARVLKAAGASCVVCATLAKGE